MKLRLILPKKKLRATAAAIRPTANPHEMEEDEEPSMKISNAFIVVLALHFVAVGGIYAFNSFKARNPSAFDEPVVKQVTPATGLAGVKPETPKTAPVANTKFTAPTAAGTTAKPAMNAAATATKVETAKTVDATATTASTKGMPRDSGKTHLVVKGENPVTIAKQYGVSYEDILKLNHIDDPRKLKVGAKLHIPVKSKASNN